MASAVDAKEALGELIITGFDGLELASATETFLSQSRIGGVLLFSKNYESPAQVAELANQIQECRSGAPLWVSVDHEGGKVQRFRKPFTRIPVASDIARAGSPKLSFDVSEVIAKELKAVGMNLNWYPVADIHTNPGNPVIGNRAYGSTEEEVSKHVTAALRGHLVQGVQACVKHFPGHGDTSVDSHLALPKVTTPLETLRERELKPFSRAFKSRCSFVMTAHIINPAVDADWPATLSRKWLREILRGEMRYTKAIVSDDLEMKAITDHFGAADAPRLALHAGCDLLIYRTEEAARAAYDALQGALATGRLAPEIVLESAERVRALKRELLGDYAPIAIADLERKIGTPEHQAIVDRISSSA